MEGKKKVGRPRAEGKKKVGISISEEVFENLKRQAGSDGRTISGAIEVAILAWLKK